MEQRPTVVRICFFHAGRDDSGRVTLEPNNYPTLGGTGPKLDGRESGSQNLLAAVLARSFPKVK